VTDLQYRKNSAKLNTNKDMDVGKHIHENPSDNDVDKHIHENPSETT
jgi:hypothetical protein